GLVAGAALKPAGGHPGAAAAAGTPAETSTPGTSRPDASTLADGKALLAQVAEPPAGATTAPVIGSTGGVMDIDQFVAKFFTKRPDRAKASLTNDNFKVAAQRNWTGSDGVEVQDQLVEFASEADAQRYVTGQNQALQADED